MNCPIHVIFLVLWLIMLLLLKIFLVLRQDSPYVEMSESRTRKRSPSSSTDSGSVELEERELPGSVDGSAEKPPVGRKRLTPSVNVERSRSWSVSSDDALLSKSGNRNPEVFTEQLPGLSPDNPT